MPKTDPEIITLGAVGTVTVTAPSALNSATVQSIEGGTVTRADAPLAGGETLQSGETLTFTPTTAGGTTYLNVRVDNAEFSGHYDDLDGAPAPSSGGTATLGSQGGGNLMLTAQGTTTDTSVSRVTFQFLAQTSRPVWLRQIWVQGYIANNSAGNPPRLYMIDANGNTLLETIPLIGGGSIALDLVTPRRIQPGEELFIDFPVAATLAVSAQPAPIEGVQMYYTAAGASGSAKGNMTVIFGAVQYVSIPGALNPDAMPLYRTPLSSAGGSFEVIDPPDGTPYLRYVAYDGKEYRWPGTLLT